MQKHNINSAIISSQKGLALPPGLTMVVLDKKAQQRVIDVNSHYFNFKNYLKDGERGQTPYTPAVSIILQLQARLKQIKKDGGVQSTIQKAKDIAHYFREQIKDLPLKFYTPYMPNAMTALVPTNNVSAKKIVDDFENNYKSILCPNGGELSDSVFRIGHMGDLDIKDIDILVEQLRDYYNKEK
jgi:aspartate aminotransferase-like enzyme